VDIAVGAENAVTSRDLRILVEEAAKPIASSNADVVVGRHGVGPALGWLLCKGPVRPVGVVVIDVFAEDVAEMSSAADEDALAPGAGDPALADGVRPRRLDRRCDDPDAGRGEDGVERVGVLGVPDGWTVGTITGTTAPALSSLGRGRTTAASGRGWAPLEKDGTFRAISSSITSTSRPSAQSVPSDAP
jgi:hypothetical protein